jgi:uncharacterized membrane protein YccC
MNNQHKKKSKTLPFITGLIIGAVIGGVLGIFIISPILLLLLSFAGFIQGDALPKWAGTLVSVTVILSVNFGIYIGVKWRLKAAGNTKSNE